MSIYSNYYFMVSLIRFNYFISVFTRFCVEFFQKIGAVNAAIILAASGLARTKLARK